MFLKLFSVRQTAKKIYFFTTTLQAAILEAHFFLKGTPKTTPSKIHIHLQQKHFSRIQNLSVITSFLHHRAKNFDPEIFNFIFVQHINHEFLESDNFFSYRVLSPNIIFGSILSKV